MQFFEFLRTKGKTEATKIRDRCYAINKLGSAGVILSSVAGLGASAELLVHIGKIDWDSFNILEVYNFYQWPEKVRWLTIVVAYFLIGIILIVLHFYLQKKYNCSINNGGD